MTLSPSPRTLFEKIWDDHVIEQSADGPPSFILTATLSTKLPHPKLLKDLRLTGRTVRRPEATLAVADHNVPTKNRHCRNP
jgi:3-isopropylmalate/(R)-2-methylmalate dehydratase large subunit